MIGRQAGDRLASGLIVLVLALGASLAATQGPETIVWGRVVNALNDAPISGAVVTVRGQGPTAPRTQLTDAQGRFLFRLASPTYRISVTRPGYAYGLPWDPAMDDPAGPALLRRASNSADPLTLPMWPLAEMAGTVVDDFGRPVVGIMVRADPVPRYPGRSRRPVVARTDDRGQYRLSDLAPGSYVVGAQLPATIAVPNRRNAESRPGVDAERAALLDRVPVLQLDDWALQVPPASWFTGPFLGGTVDAPMVAPPIYYPNTRDPGAAQELALRPGQVLDGLNMVLTVEPGYRIRGTVRIEGQPRAGLQVAALPAVADAAASRRTVVVASATTDRDGRFLLAGIPPGLYRVVALPPRPVGAITQRDVPSLWAEAIVDVTTRHVQDVDLNPESLPPFEAVVSTVNDPAVPLMVERVSIAMEGDPEGLRAGPMLMRFAPESDGRVNMGQMAPGDYAMQVTASPGWVVHSLSLDGRLIAGRVIRRSARAASVLRINLTSEHGSAAISVRRSRAGGNDSGSVVVVFPAQRDMWGNAAHDVDRFKLMPVDSTGRAEFAALLPGDYLAAAIDTDRPGLAWRDRRVLERLALDASAVRVAARAQASAVVTPVAE
jgi:hypothetical protein